MRREWISTWGLGLLLTLGGSAAQAGPNEHAVLVLYLATGDDPLVCSLPGDSCTDLPTDSPLGGAVAYLMVANTSPSSGIAGVQVGLAYDGDGQSGVDIESWFPCTDMAYPDANWPDAGAGAMLLWETGSLCPGDGTPRVLAVFHLRAHTADRLALVAHPGRGSVEVVSCDGDVDTLTGNLPSPLGILEFGGGRGYNPCSRIVPIDPSTWGTIESLFARS